MNTTTDTIREQLSALADGELDTAQSRLLLARLAREPALRAAWARYHLTGDAIRGALADYHAPRLADDVMAVIDADATVTGRLSGLPRWLKPVAGTAVAATVATVAVLSLQQQSTPLPAEIVPSTDAQTASVVPALQNTVRAASWGASEPASQKRLVPYLEQHNRYATQRSIQGMLPYAHIVVYQPNREAANDKDDKPNTSGQAKKLRLNQD